MSNTEGNKTVKVILQSQYCPLPPSSAISWQTHATNKGHIIAHYTTQGLIYLRAVLNHLLWTQENR
ncbi:unnamed protein product [Ceratitis capitata]|uniref:(Mediterranean fruit fly) hypothetical protein n=1 Tax=Ceratitis capitata TaxID=7213 RepID=A0A811UHA8_CERCA|nr:unnamed protein product [Ceratitis capitata]